MAKGAERKKFCEDLEGEDGKGNMFRFFKKKFFFGYVLYFSGSQPLESRGPLLSFVTWSRTTTEIVSLAHYVMFIKHIRITDVISRSIGHRAITASL